MKRERSGLRPTPHRPDNELAIARSWRIQLLGGRELQAEGSRGIVQCDAETVAFRVGGAVFYVYGRDLTIGTLQDGELVIRGKILRTELIP